MNVNNTRKEEQTQAGFHVLCIEGYKKEPVLEFPSVAKNDQPNDKVGDTRKGR